MGPWQPPTDSATSRAASRRPMVGVFASAALVAVLGLIVALVWQPRGTGVPTVGTMEQLDARPEASLYYPGSILIDDGGYPASSEGRAGIWKMLGTDAAMNEVIAFYRREVAARGLTPGGGLTVGGILSESQICTWHTPDFVFRLSFWKLDEWRGRYPDEPGYSTVYEVRLLDRKDAKNLGECKHPID